MAPVVLSAGCGARSNADAPGAQHMQRRFLGFAQQRFDLAITRHQHKAEAIALVKALHHGAGLRAANPAIRAEQTGLAGHSAASVAPQQPIAQAGEQGRRRHRARPPGPGRRCR